MKLRIRNWHEYQHYKDRCPPWIKLHFRMLSSKDWVMLDDRSRVLAVACMLIASQSDNSDLDPGEFEADGEYIKRVAYLNHDPDFKPLIERGFLEVASGCNQMLADDTKCSPETETEAETEKDSAKADGKPSLNEKLWGEGLETLARLAGKDANKMRGALGKWRKDHGDQETLDAIIRAEKEAVSEPVAWVTAALKAKGGNEADRFRGAV